MLNFISGQSLSVRQRLMTLGVAAVVGIGSMLGVGWYQNAGLDSALRRAVQMKADVERVNEMQLANANLVLAAMDTIIDRSEGAIQPERIAIIDTAVNLLAAGSSTLKSIANEAGAASEVATYDDDLKAVAGAIQIDLKRLVENGAAEEDYAAIDDAIDGAGERLGNVLSKIATLGGKEVEERVGEATARSRSALSVQLSLGGIAFVLVVLLQLIHGNSIANGIRSVRASMQRIVDGDYDSEVEGTDRQDEIGGMARSTDIFRRAAIEKRDLETSTRDTNRQNEAERESRTAAMEADTRALKLAVDALGGGLMQLSEGDLCAEIRGPFPADLERLRNDFNQVTLHLRTVMGEIAANSSSIRANGQQMRSAADDLARRTEQQAASLEETSAALSEITATVQSATHRAEEASHMVDDARDFTEKSGLVVNDAMAAMERIEDATGEIGKIINVIDEIAFQTNLLALNAGVEAARAGDAGKGFAVVAQEVRALAGRAAEAARDIKSLVGRSSEEVKTGVELVTATGDALHRIGEDVLRINEHVKAIVTSAREQSVGLSEINSAVGQMDQVTQQNAAMVEQTNAASHTLAGDAENLSRLVGQFQVGSDQPVAAYRPEPAQVASKPRPSPAKALIEKVAGTFNRTTPASSSNAAVAEHWEEF
ncbi:methyl-accepting chemotaxis sensory transducer [Rhizobium sp. PDO1-076]|uniref:methyl-accepting chemotaxis protein n=1 Tax=Rhizobium sp. PDO1-076 TaxID=1125979 RepID=UPI00024E326A|nr:HAMP domain-containing methyl-accepting chemotaxis protein [Rhizobium sp. PDO1-076]EHS51590.1 methyl-accepting chemotaxis sensory transducer [Rhizobium sp. PDO1-076]